MEQIKAEELEVVEGIMSSIKNIPIRPEVDELIRAMLSNAFLKGVKIGSNYTSCACCTSNPMET